MEVGRKFLTYVDIEELSVVGGLGESQRRGQRYAQRVNCSQAKIKRKIGTGHAPNFVLKWGPEEFPKTSAYRSGTGFGPTPKGRDIARLPWVLRGRHHPTHILHSSAR